MLGKLLKYDIKYGKSAYLSMAGGMLLLAFLVRFTELPLLKEFGEDLILPLLMVVVFTAGVILVFQNFNKNLFGAEGYLTLTLPVKRYKLMLSKLLTSMMWVTMLLLATGIVNMILYPGFSLTHQFVNEVDPLPVMYGVLNTAYDLVTLVLVGVNAALALYLLSAAAHISIAGKRLGWPLGIAVLVGYATLEALFGTKLLDRVAGTMALWFIWPTPGSELSINFAMNNPFDVYASVHAAFYVDIRLILTLTLFCVLAWLLTLHCLKKRVDLP